MPQTPWGNPSDFADRATYITPDGVEYMLSAPTFILQEDGLGMPPIEYVTERGPFQNGETVKDVFMRPRTIQLIVRRNGCTRAEYWNLRNQLLDIMRPGRVSGAPSLDTGGAAHNAITGPMVANPTALTPSPGILRKYLANGAVRELFVYTSEGPGFASHAGDVWDQWSIQDVIRFTAYDPIARDPVLQAKVFQSTGTSGTFPLTFPWLFSAFGAATQNLVYAGTFPASPNMLIVGPITSPLIRNVTTGEKIQFTFDLSSFESVVVDLAYGHKTVTRNDGTNMIGYVSSDSDFATFHLNPGVNAIQVSSTGTSASSSITLTWYNRYIGM